MWARHVESRALPRPGSPGRTATGPASPGLSCRAAAPPSASAREHGPRSRHGEPCGSARRPRPSGRATPRSPASGGPSRGPASSGTAPELAASTWSTASIHARRHASPPSDGRPSRDARPDPTSQGGRGRPPAATWPSRLRRAPNSIPTSRIGCPPDVRHAPLEFGVRRPGSTAAPRDHGGAQIASVAGRVVDDEPDLDRVARSPASASTRAVSAWPGYSVGTASRSYVRSRRVDERREGRAS